MATVEFFGESFGLHEGMSEFALMEFADAAESGIEQSGMAAMAAMLRLIKTCIAEDDAVGDDGKPCSPYGLSRFMASARKNRPSSDELIAVLNASAEQMTGRPTSRSVVSSDGPPSIELKSVSVSEDSASRLLAGRPDLRLAVQRMKAQVQESA